MFFGKHAQEKLLADIRELLCQNRDTFQNHQESQRQTLLHIEETVMQHQKILDALLPRLDSQEEQIRENGKRIRRQSDSFEDLLEELQTREKEQTSLETLLKEKTQREQSLIALVACCREQMELWEQMLEKDTSLGPEQKTAWHDQLLIMNRQVLAAMQKCGIEETGYTGEPVDYQLCEVLEAIETEDCHLAGTIARVYRKGILSYGKVASKAQVAAYRQKS